MAFNIEKALAHVLSIMLLSGCKTQDKEVVFITIYFEIIQNIKQPVNLLERQKVKKSFFTRLKNGFFTSQKLDFFT